jgi:two-component system LytT family response regulator
MVQEAEARSRTRLRAVVVDDEPLARDGLRDELESGLGVQVVAACANGDEACDAITRLRPDVLFLDVEMPEIDGFEVLERLEPEDVPPAVVFVTAFDAHALRAFDAHALDYVLKPIVRERLRAAVDRSVIRVREALALRDLVERDAASPSAAPTAPASDSPAVAPAERYVSRLVVRERGRTLVVRTADLDWIQADTYYVRLHAGAESRLLRERMAVLEARLDPAQFFRTHRSAIVRLDRVKEVRSVSRYEHSVILTTGACVRLSRDRRAQLESLLR